MTHPTIIEPGEYGLTYAEYRSDICDGPSVCYEDLVQLLTDTPAAFWRTSSLNPKRVDAVEPTGAIWRRACTTFMVNPAAFADEYAVARWEAGGQPIGASRTSIRGGADLTMADMTKVIEADKMACQLMFDPGCEHGMTSVWRHPDHDIWVKCRSAIMHPHAVVHYFPQRHIVTDDIMKSIRRFRLPVESVIGIETRWHLHGNANLPASHIWQETPAPHRVRVTQLSPAYLEIGQALFSKAMRIMAECLEADEWPDHEVIEQLEPTKWELREIEE